MYSIDVCSAMPSFSLSTLPTRCVSPLLLLYSHICHQQSSNSSALRISPLSCLACFVCMRLRACVFMVVNCVVVTTFGPFFLWLDKIGRAFSLI